MQKKEHERDDDKEKPQPVQPPAEPEPAEPQQSDPELPPDPPTGGH